MNILQISVNDFGGCAYALAEAIKATTEHDSISVRASPGSYIKYPIHVVASHPDDLIGVWNWADVVHVHDVMPQLPPGLPNKPTVVTYHGSMYRRNPPVYNRLVQRFRWVGTVATIDLTQHSLPWMPDCRPDLSKYVDRPKGRTIVAHAPTSRLVKDTDKVIAALDGQEGFALDVIERVDYETCLRRKGRAMVYVDQFRLCYGLNAVEAWAMGMPVIANAKAPTPKLIKAIMGELPFVATLEKLRETVGRLLADKAFYAEAVQRGRDCYYAFHAPSAAAAKALEYYEQAREIGVPKAMPMAKGRYRSRGEILLAGDAGIVVLRYRGGNVGRFSVDGPVTNTRYEFDGRDEMGRRRLVDVRDARELVKPRTRGRGTNSRMGGVVEYEVVG